MQKEERSGGLKERLEKTAGCWRKGPGLDFCFRLSCAPIRLVSWRT